MSTVMVDCGRCEVRGVACPDCVISTLMSDASSQGSPRFGDDEQQALNALADSGLLPPLRLVASAGRPLPPRVPSTRAG